MSDSQCDNSKDHLHEQIANLRDNHFAHLAADVTEIKVTIGKHGVDLEWLKKAFWIVAGASLTAAVAGIANLLLNR